MPNLFAAIPADLPGELFETLLESAAVRIERIVSRGHVTPPGDWYDQEQDEWVLLLQGEARLAYADREAELCLQAGDYVLIRAHERHRVAFTATDQDTVWLAVFLNAAGQE
ncbi:cupin domain-containing protein [Candidatus Thiothrix sp. Deng01]|uniref:Cupin domain-containing protein n=1 Tax=Candidatus Thiothrix phosphatis TaxID=3112415 RepID=A0ABU6CYI6_9GAMM|nr:cupin domain-containing protein [Candidatus Thiothrix sp. Deng01]MEB4591142.1 cupin domain-containing protein [Candidatus Thiothrix sp. Deng01]